MCCWYCLRRLSQQLSSVVIDFSAPPYSRVPVHLNKRLHWYQNDDMTPGSTEYDKLQLQTTTCDNVEATWTSFIFEHVCALFIYNEDVISLYLEAGEYSLLGYRFDETTINSCLSLNLLCGFANILNIIGLLVNYSPRNAKIPLFFLFGSSRVLGCLLYTSRCV